MATPLMHRSVMINYRARLFITLHLAFSGTAYAQLIPYKERIMIAKGSFEVTFSPQDDEIDTGRMVIHRVYLGDIVGAGQGQMLSKRTATEGSAAYVAIEVVTGKLNGLQGSFALQHTGSMSRGVDALSVTVIPDSGTLALVGLTGTLQIERIDNKHFYTFEYSITD